MLWGRIFSLPRGIIRFFRGLQEIEQFNYFMAAIHQRYSFIFSINQISGVHAVSISFAVILKSETDAAIAYSERQQVNIFG